MNLNKNSSTNSVPTDELRLITRAAWLYYMQGLTQSEVAEELKLLPHEGNSADRPRKKHGDCGYSYQSTRQAFLWTWSSN